MSVSVHNTSVAIVVMPVSYHTSVYDPYDTDVRSDTRAVSINPGVRAHTRVARVALDPQPYTFGPPLRIQEIRLCPHL